MSSQKLLALLWCGVIVSLAIFLGFQFSSRQVLNINILSLLPDIQREQLVAESVARVHGDQSRRMIVVVGHQQREVALTAVSDLGKQLESFVSLELGSDRPGGEADTFEKLAQIAALYKTYDRGLVADGVHESLKEGAYREVVDAAYVNLYSPLATVSSATLTHDPFFLFSGFLNDVQFGPQFSWLNGWPYIFKDGLYYVLFLAELKQDAFNLEYQVNLVNSIDQWQAKLEDADSGLQVLKTGAVFYAQDGVARAKAEISIVGLGSALGIVLLFFGVFRNIKSLLFVLASLAIGVLVASAVVVMVFSQLHFMALVFGATLLGISIDYSFHFYSEYYFNDKGYKGAQVIELIKPALFFGLVSSVIAYLSLMLGAFPGLQQIALFSAVGLITAFLNVLLFYPLLFSAPAALRKEMIPVTKILSAGVLKPSKQLVWISGVVAVVSIVLGVRLLSPNDDVRLLQPVSESLKSQQNQIDKLLNAEGLQHFFIVHASSLETLLQKEEQLRADVHRLSDQPVESMMLSKMLPSVARQQDVSIAKAKLLDSEPAKNYLRGLGLPEGVTPQSNPGWLQKRAFANTPLEKRVSDFLLVQGEQFASVVYFTGIETNALASLNQPGQGVVWVDRAAEISEVFREYRAKAGQLLTLAVLVISGFLCLRYGLVVGLKAAAVPLLACGLMLALLGYWAADFNLFHLLGLMVVLGLGLDYAIFLTERQDAHAATFVAVCLSVITTVFAFGLLSLSSTPAVSSFGSVVLMGVLTTFLLSILLLQPSESST